MSLEQLLKQAEVSRENLRAALERAHAEHDPLVRAADNERVRHDEAMREHYAAYSTIMYDAGVRLGILNAYVVEEDRWHGYGSLGDSMQALTPICFTDAFNEAVLDWAGLRSTDDLATVVMSRGDDLFFNARRELAGKTIREDAAYIEHSNKTGAMQQALRLAQIAAGEARRPLRAAEEAVRVAEEAVRAIDLKMISAEQRAEARAESTATPKAPKVSAADKERFVKAHSVLGDVKTRNAKPFTWSQK